MQKSKISVGHVYLFPFPIDISSFILCYVVRFYDYVSVLCLAAHIFFDDAMEPNDDDEQVPNTYVKELVACMDVACRQRSSIVISHISCLHLSCSHTLVTFFFHSSVSYSLSPVIYVSTYYLPKYLNIYLCIYPPISVQGMIIIVVHWFISQ